jgi:hypothetical protein
MIRRSRTSIVKALRMSAPEIARTAGIVEIAVAGEGVRAAVVVVAGAGAVVAAAAVVGMAVGMVATAGTGAAEGIKPGITIYKKSKSPPCCTKRDKGGAPGDGELRLGRGSFHLGRICVGEQEMLWAFPQRARRNIFSLRHSM